MKLLTLRWLSKCWSLPPSETSRAAGRYRRRSRRTTCGCAPWPLVGRVVTPTPMATCRCCDAWCRRARWHRWRIVRRDRCCGSLVGTRWRALGWHTLARGWDGRAACSGRQLVVQWRSQARRSRCSGSPLVGSSGDRKRGGAGAAGRHLLGPVAIASAAEPGAAGRHASDRVRACGLSCQRSRTRG